MRKETAFNILEQAYKIGVREVGFYMISEPFLSKILEDCTLYAKNLGYTYIYLTTNGSLANPDRVKKLFAGGLNSIKFSVNAGRPDTYKRVHGKGDFEKVINNIHMADKARREMNIDGGLFVSFVENIINKGEIDSLKDA
jgi:MoaA/NifB/PqqE/SkfB family radical SAM enzyme